MGSFDSLEKQFSAVVHDLTVKVDAAESSSDKAVLSAIQQELDQADGMVKSMDLEARTSDQGQQSQRLERLLQHKIKLSVLKRDFRKKTGGIFLPGNRGPSSHSELSSVLDPGSDSASTAGTSGDQRDRLLISNARLGATSERLGTTRQLALQAEHMGVTILKDLHDQRQSLLNSRDMLQDVDDEISKARHILRMMVAKMNRNKWTVGLIIGLLFAAIAIVSFAKLRH